MQKGDLGALCEYFSLLHEVGGCVILEVFCLVSCKLL